MAPVAINAVAEPGRVHLRLVTTGSSRRAEIFWGEPAPTGNGGTIRQSTCHTPCDAYVWPGQIWVKVWNDTFGVPTEKWFSVVEPDQRIVFDAMSPVHVAGWVTFGLGGTGSLSMLLALAKLGNGKNHDEVVSTQRILLGSVGVLAAGIFTIAISNPGGLRLEVSPVGMSGRF